MNTKSSRPCQYRFLSDDEVRSIGFRQVGKNVLIHELTNIVFPENISIGDHVRIDGYSNIVAGKSIHIGSHVHLGSFCHFSASAELHIGDFSGISQSSMVYTASDDFSGRFLTGPTIPEEFRGPTTGPVMIGRHVILGAGTVVLPNVHIGDGVALGARSLVNRDLAAWGVYFGVPAVRRSERRRDVLELEQALRQRQLP